MRASTSANWIGGNYLRRGIQISLAFIKGGQVSIEIYIDLGHRQKNEDIFFALQEKRENIEREIGALLLWQDLKGKRACRIRFAMSGSIDEPHSHSALIKEMVTQHVAFKRVFKPLVEELPQEIWDQDPVTHEKDADE
ncbi:MAG: DUF4268 domain-containing protein [Betaproteobacteria bacterium]|nr:DUF4268 domain-containing protein [Betaproteobacteria bacterium]